MASIYGFIVFKGSNKDLIERPKTREIGDRILALLVWHSIFAPKTNFIQNNNIKKVYIRAYF